MYYTLINYLSIYLFCRQYLMVDSSRLRLFLQYLHSPSSWKLVTEGHPKRTPNPSVPTRVLRPECLIPLKSSITTTWEELPVSPWVLSFQERDKKLALITHTKAQFQSFFFRIILWGLIYHSHYVYIIFCTHPFPRYLNRRGIWERVARKRG